MKARYLTFIGTAIALAISSSSAVAQSSTVPREIKLSQQTGGGAENLNQPNSSPSTNQAPAPGAVPPSQTQPQAPAPGAVPPSQTQPQAPQAQVSQEELQKFANAVKKLQPLQRDAQKQVSQAIVAQKLSEERFGEIYQSRQNPQAQPTKKISSEENKKFEQANAQIEKIQTETQSKMVEAVQAEGLDKEQFNRIFSAIRQNPQLMEQVQKMIQS